MAEGPERYAGSVTRVTEADQPWSQVWHLPVLLLGVFLFVVGVYLAMQPEDIHHDFPGALKDVGLYIHQAKNYDAAEDMLRGMQEAMELEGTDEQLGKYWQLWADLTYLQQRERLLVPVDTRVSRTNNEKIISRYQRAQEYGQELNGTSLQYLAITLAALGRDNEALAIVERLPLDPASRRYLIVKSLIEKQIERSDHGDVEQLARYIERFKKELRNETDRGKRREQEIWITSLESQLRLDSGDPQGAIDFRFMTTIQRLTDEGGDNDLGPLFVILAKAYQQMGEFDNARFYYDYAQQKVDIGDDLNATILVGLGQLALAQSGDMTLQQALEYFAAAVKQYPTAPAFLDALVGQADVEARLGDYTMSTDHFRLAVKQLSVPGKVRSKKSRLSEKVAELVNSHVEKANDEQDYDRSLEFLSLLKPLYKPDMPPALILEFAYAHERIAQQREEYVDRLNPSGDSLDQFDDGSPARKAIRLANQEAAIHYGEAADYFLRHAQMVTISDDEAHGLSLWKAATSFDKAQQWKDAIKVYNDYVRTRPDDPRRLMAINHLGKAYLADGQYEASLDRFRQLLREHPSSPQTFDSLVPMARAYLALEKYEEAERSLLQVVTDHPSIRPDSPSYREALVELGKLYYRLGERDAMYYVNAIERLTEAVERYGETYQSAMLRFLLADSYRKSVEELDEQLQQRRSQRDRLALQAERLNRLEQSQMYYNQVITELEVRDESTMNPLQRLYYRNSYFYQADCAFDRMQYEMAIELYSQAARRWESDPASLVALVQIVNAYCELGQYQQAKVANETAIWQLERMPEEAFDAPNLPMTRQHWEDWLRWTSELDLFGSQANAAATMESLDH